MSPSHLLTQAGVFLPGYAWLRTPSTLWSEVTVQINADHYIKGKLCSLWTSECESEFEKQYMEI